MSRLNKIFFIIIIFLSSNIFPQDFWVNTNGPNGGKIGDIGINSKDELFSGGWWESSGIFRSADDGTTWTKINYGFRNFEVYAIGIGKNDHIFLGTNQQGIFRSTDNGESWQKKDNGYTTAECWTFAFNDSGDIFAGDGDWAGIYKSSDNGENWSWLIELATLVITINRNGDIYAGTWQGLYKSTDNGNTWNQITNGLPNLSIPCIAFDIDGGIYVGTGYYSNGNGVYYSGDNGTTWGSLGLTDTIVQSIVITDDYKIYAGTFNNGVMLSTDRGKNWNSINNGLFDYNIFRLKQNSKGDLFTGSETHGGIYKSSTAGQSWTQIGLPTSVIQSIDSNDKDRLLFTGTVGGVHSLNLNNGEWKNLGLGNEVSSVAVKNDSIVFAGTLRNGLYRSFNNGDTWELTTITPDSLLFIENLFVMEDGALILLTSNYPRISYDDGITWQTWTNGITYPYVNGIDVNPFGDIFISNSAAVFRSTNNGLTFETVNSNHSIGKQGIAVNDHSGVFITDSDGGTSGGIYRSLDNGSNWQKVKNISAFSIMVANDQSVYSGVNLGANLNGIITSSDNGTTWEEISSGLDLEKPISSFHQDKIGYIYAGSYGGGLYVSRDPVSSVSDNKINVVDYYLFQNYPNPFNPSTKISWQSPVSSHQTLKVYDILGNEVVTLVNEYRNAGRYEIDFNASKLASGVYFYRIQAGSFTETKKMVVIK